jgi:hypothetical protein
MSSPARPLSFEAVDGLAFAAAVGQSEAARAGPIYVPRDLGPLLELLHLEATGRVPEAPRGKSWLASNSASPMMAALRDQRESWIKPDDRRIGFIRAARSGPDGDHRLVSFLMDAQRAAMNIAGLPGATPAQMAAAMEELEDNIHEHSEAAPSGLLAFRAAPGVFEFVAADSGIGVLASLRHSQLFASVPDHGKALRAALTEGTSRFGPGSGHGYGFRPIFTGLANLRGFLRFRSGDHALIIDCKSPDIRSAQLAQKAFIDGFFVSIRCQATRRRQVAANIDTRVCFRH